MYTVLASTDLDAAVTSEGAQVKGKRYIFGVEGAADLAAIDADLPDALPFSRAHNTKHETDPTHADAFFAVKNFQGTWDT